MKFRTWMTSGASIAALAMGLACVSGATAQAQTAPAAAQQGASLEEVVVTARKREESLNTVPLAVSAFSANQIQQRGLSSVNDISSSTPSFHFQNQAGGGSGRNDRTINTLTFRGLVLSNDIGTRAGGLMFVDGAPVIGNVAPGLGPEVERVEVLKGPQSAFFGRSTFSGAVNIVTKDPPNVLTGSASVGASSYNSHTEQFSLGGPIVQDVLMGRFTIFNEVKGGQWTNAAPPNETFGDQRTSSIGGQLLWKPTSSLRIKASFTGYENKDGPPSQLALKQGQMNCNLNPVTVPSSFTSTFIAGNPQVANPNANNKYYCGAIPTADKLSPSIISGNYRLDALSYGADVQNSKGFALFFDPSFQQSGGMHRQGMQSSLHIDYDLPKGYTLTSVTAFHADKTMSILDLDFRDGSNIPNLLHAAVPATESFVSWLLAYQAKNNDISQEIRLTSPQDQRFRWMVGGNYISADEYTGAVYGAGQFGVAFGSTELHYHPTTPAAFGAGYFDITSQLTLSAELRYQVDQVALSLPATQAGVALNPQPGLSKNYQSVSPRVNLEYKFMPGSLAYVLFSRGYRPGGFNYPLVPALGAGPQLLAAATGGGYNTSFDQERLDNYEAGVKSRFFHNTVQLNADIYYDKYTNGQISQTVTYFSATGVLNQSALIKNVGAIELKGLELEGTWQTTRHLQLAGTLAINNTKILQGYCSDCTTIQSQSSGIGVTPVNNGLAGKKLPLAPEYSATIGAEYTDKLTSSIDWYARGDYQYRGREYVDQANVAWIGDKNTLNLRLGIRTPSYSVEFFCTNCTNDLTAESGSFASADLFSISPGPTTQEIRYGLPVRRMLGGRVTASF
jgi:iron complex outermembrane receptor protein